MTDDASAKRLLGKRVFGAIALRAKSEAAAGLAVELSEAMLATSPAEFDEQVIAVARRVAAGSGVSIFNDEHVRAVVEICRSVVRIYAGRVRAAATGRAGEWLVEALEVERSATPAADGVSPPVDPSVEPRNEDAPAPAPAPATPGNGAGNPP